MKRAISGISKSNSSEITLVAANANPVRDGRRSYGGSFHIHGFRAEGMRQVSFLLNSSHGHKVTSEF